MKHDATDQLSHTAEHSSAGQPVLGLLHCLPTTAAAELAWEGRGRGWGAKDGKVEELEPGWGSVGTIGAS